MVAIKSLVICRPNVLSNFVGSKFQIGFQAGSNIQTCIKQNSNKNLFYRNVTHSLAVL